MRSSSIKANAVTNSDKLTANEFLSLHIKNKENKPKTSAALITTPVRTKRRTTRRKISNVTTYPMTLSSLLLFITLITKMTNNVIIPMNMPMLVNAAEDLSTNAMNSTNTTTTTNSTANSTTISTVNSAETVETNSTNNSTEKVNATVPGSNSNSTNQTTTNVTISSTETKTASQPVITWTGCVNPKTKKMNKLKKGERTTICVVVSKGGNWANQTNGTMEYSRITFEPTVDEYSSFLVNHSFTDLILHKEVNGVVYKPHISVHVGSNQSLSFIRRFYDESHFKVYPYLTAIIDVEDGVIKGIEWDDACLFCNSTRCEENTYDFNGVQATSISNTKGCYIPLIECVDTVDDLPIKTISNTSKLDTSNLTPVNECQLKLYFVWTGTDADGRPLQSYESRFGAFPGNMIPQFSQITDISNSVKSWFNEKKDMINNTLFS